MSTKRNLADEKFHKRFRNLFVFQTQCGFVPAKPVTEEATVISPGEDITENWEKRLGPSPGLATSRKGRRVYINNYLKLLINYSITYSLWCKYYIIAITIFQFTVFNTTLIYVYHRKYKIYYNILLYLIKYIMH